MKRFFPITFFAGFAILISCAETEEPVNPLFGAWENRVFVDSLDVWIVETMEFKNDSILEISETVRQTEFGQNLGFQFFMESKFSLNNEIIHLDFSTAFILPWNYPAIPLFVQKSELREIVFGFTIYNSGEFVLSPDLNELDFSPICFTEFEQFCPTTKKYFKINS